MPTQTLLHKDLWNYKYENTILEMSLLTVKESKYQYCKKYVEVIQHLVVIPSSKQLVLNSSRKQLNSCILSSGKTNF